MLDGGAKSRSAAFGPTINEGRALDTSSSLAGPDPVEELISFLSPVVVGLIQRIDPDVPEFTTPEFIALLETEPVAALAYRQALTKWGEDERRAKMVVHGQVIPVAMRRSGLVEWLGFAYDEEDAFAVPARWRLIQQVSVDG